MSLLGKVVRGSLWVVLPPAGAVASVKHSKNKRSTQLAEKIVAAQNRTTDHRYEPKDHRRT
jgi:hypothetical protein